MCRHTILEKLCPGREIPLGRGSCDRVLSCIQETWDPLVHLCGGGVCVGVCGAITYLFN